jgi:Rod binding domain-containing protein
MSEITAASPGSAALAAPNLQKPKNAAEAAKQFEGLLIAQMLRSAREASQADDDDSTGETMFDMAGQQFAQVLANNGGMGLGKLIAKELNSSTAEQTQPDGRD